jgi:hypothetical protein
MRAFFEHPGLYKVNEPVFARAPFRRDEEFIRRIPDELVHNGFRAQVFEAFYHEVFVFFKA